MSGDQSPFVTDRLISGAGKGGMTITRGERGERRGSGAVLALSAFERTCPRGGWSSAERAKKLPRTHSCKTPNPVNHHGRAQAVVRIFQDPR